MTASAQIVTGYLGMLALLPRAKRIEALAEIIPLIPDTEIRAPLLREFNSLLEKEPA